MVADSFDSRQWIFLEGKILSATLFPVVIIATSGRDRSVPMVHVIIQTVSLSPIVKEWNSISVWQKESNGQCHANVPGRMSEAVENYQCIMLLNGKENYPSKCKD